MKTRVRVLISGEVQGVFFRSETKRRADNLNVKGWVRNREDGRVEAVFEGEEKDVMTLVEFCKRGPRGAFVTNVDLVQEEKIEVFNNFKIRY